MEKVIVPSDGDSLLASKQSHLQEKKLRLLLRDATSCVPMYERLYSDVDVDDRKLTLLQILARLPIISKAALLSTPIEDRQNSRFVQDNLFEESTTGSTGQPFSLRIESAYRKRRNLRFLRALFSVGYRPWQRLMLLTDRYNASKHVGLNRYYEPVEQPTSAILDAYRRIQPHVLYGFLTPLRLLAENLPASSRIAHRPQLVVSTAEMLDRNTKKNLEDAFGCPVADFYGMTEMGLVAWQRPCAERYIMSQNSVLTELIPISGERNGYRMIMTNLDLRASPIIRFDSGDLAGVHWVNRKPHIVAIEGRRIDTIICSNGEELSPYRITDALRDIIGLRRFKITQRDVLDIFVELEVDEDRRDPAAREVRAILDELVGNGLNCEIQFSSELVPDGTRKFRPVESLVARL